MSAPRVTLETNLGKITLELFDKDAPVTVENFLKYVDNGHYDGLIFHRVIPGFMIQGGGMTPDMAQKKTLPPIKNEATNGALNRVGTIAMARTSIIDSATSQFFINVNDNHFLNHRSKNPQEFGYAVFGHVVEGMDVVRDIEAAETGHRAGHDDVPIETITIIKAARV